MTGPANTRRSIESLLVDGKVQAADQRCALMVKAGAFVRDATQILAAAKRMPASRPPLRVGDPQAMAGRRVADVQSKCSLLSIRQ